MTTTTTTKIDDTAIAVLGGGRMGEAVGTILGATGKSVRVWEISKARRDTLAKTRPKLDVTDDLERTIGNAATIFFAVPSTAFVDVARAFAPFARGDHVVLHGARGVSSGFTLPHDVIKRETCVKKVAALGGPLYFADVEKNRPLFVVVASRYDEAIRRVKNLVAGTPLRLHPARDVIGVEVAGAISNVTAIATGITDGLELGETARGVIAARGLSEATKLGLALGADITTFGGLAGVGDLIPRKVSSTERHQELGLGLAAGKTIEELLGQTEGAIEGVSTAREAHKKARVLGLDLPLVDGLVKIFNGEATPFEVFDRVLSLDLELGRELMRAS